MTVIAHAGQPPAAIDLNQPGTFLHWSIFEISVANLVLIAVMVVIFGAALILPFPHGRTNAADAEAEPAEDAYADGTAGAESAAPGRAGGAGPDDRMWTARVRNWALRVLPPGKLLPDRQPAYVASWVYVFGVASLAALGVVIASGFAIALGGPDWWHTNPVGHFFNSLHLWSVELFMAFLVIHLWGKFWMAAWRGRRALTWITGVVAFVFSIVEAFTGYLSQQNFDSQWIATNGKDAFNAAGIGAFFNLMNFGQMLMWHIVLLPIILVAIVGAHVLLVRVRGVSHPLPVSRPRGRGRPPRRVGCGPGRLARADPAVRHPEGGHDRRRGRAGPDLRPGRPAVLPQRAPGHGPELGPGRPGRLPGHRRNRTERHQRHRDLRAAVQHQRRSAEAPVRPGELVRGDDPDRHGADVRARPALQVRADRPAAGRRAGHLQLRVRGPAEQVGDGLRRTR